MKAISAAIVAMGIAFSLPAQSTCTITVNPAQVIHPQATKLLGLSFDGRSSADFDAGPGVDPVGYYDPADGSLLPEVASQWNRVPMGGVRYPGNLVTYNWNWSYTVGPYASRIAQPMGPNGSNTQKIQFGFDEFMDLALSKGVPYSDVQIMVNIYASVGQPNPATLAADWVEYCNTPDNGSNPREGTNWGHLRALYGHPEPYGVRIWNIGNEPWTGSEFGSTTAGANSYMAVASPIIDSMLAVDPGIDITIPFVGSSGSPWNAQIMNPSAPIPLVGRIYGVSPHAFYDTDAATPNPAPSQALASFALIASAASAKGLQVVVGDHASNAPSGDPDKAMRWEGALNTADLLLGLSQISNIELANFWIYGNVKAAWHPIRQNANGTYTLMAAAQLYESFFPFFYDKSLLSSLSNAAGGGSVANTRVAAFQSADLSKTSVIVLNTDLTHDNEIIPPLLSGYSLQTARVLTASAANQDTFYTNLVPLLGNGNYASPRISILILDYALAPLAVSFTEPMRAYPIKDAIKIEWATTSEQDCDRFEVERSGQAVDFETMATVKGHGSSSHYHMYGTYDQQPLEGVNYYRIKQMDTQGGYAYSKVFSARHEYADISAFPNPTNGALHLPTCDLIEKLEIADYLGRIAKTTYHPASKIDISDLPNGTYLLKCWDKEHQSTLQTIVITHHP